MYAEQVARELRASGIPVLSVIEANDAVDGEINITPSISIQVGSDYLVCCRVAGRGEDFAIEQGKARSTTEALIPDVRKALQGYSPDQN